MRGAGDVDPRVCEMFDNAHTSPEGQRAAQTKIINEYLDKDLKGKWAVNIHKPFFKASFEKYKKDSAKDGHIAEPRLIFMERFREGEVGLQRAIDAGQVRQFMCEGTPYCEFRRLQTEEERGTLDKRGTEKAWGHAKYDRAAATLHMPPSNPELHRPTSHPTPSKHTHTHTHTHTHHAKTQTGASKLICDFS